MCNENCFCHHLETIKARKKIYLKIDQNLYAIQWRRYLKHILLFKILKFNIFAYFHSYAPLKAAEMDKKIMNFLGK